MSTPMPADEARTLGTRIDSLLEGLHDLPDPATASRVEELIGAVVELYGLGLSRIADAVRSGPDGEQRLRELAADDVVSHLLLLHDLHPDDVDTRVQRALDTVRPYLGSHAGGVQYDGVDAEGVVQLRLEGSCDGCPSSTVTVQLAIEQAVLDAAPEASSVQVAGMVADEPRLLQIEPFQGGRGDGAGAGDVGRGTGAPGDADGSGWWHLPLSAKPGGVQAAEVGGLRLVIGNLDGTPYAYRDACAGCGAAVHGGRLDGDVLTCPSCAATFDIRRAGRGVPDGAASLDALPVLPADDGWRVSLPRAAVA